jgi:predicted permease
VTGFLALLVRLFPAAFRAQFGADMIEQIGRDQARARRRGRGAAAVSAVVTAVDLVRSAAAERVRPSWEEPGRTHTGGSHMRTWWNDWSRDLRHAGRSLRRSPGFAVVSVLTLGLAIGANAGIFSIVDTVLIDPLPYTDPERLVYIGATAPGTEFPAEFSTGAEFYVQYQESELLEGVAIGTSFTNTARVGDRTERIWMAAASTDMMPLLGVRPLLGRLPTVEDESDVVVISHAMWTTWFGNDPNVLGQSHSLGGAQRTIIGVMGPEFWFPNDNVMLWIPYVVRPDGVVPGRFGQPVIARVKAGVSDEALAEELTALARRIPDRFGGSPAYARMIERHRPVVKPMYEFLLGSAVRPLWVLLGSVGIVLLIACANVANLFLVRSEGRQRDLAVRRAIGAGRAHLVRSQMAEALVLAGLAAVLAIFMAWAAVPLYLRAAPAEVLLLDRVAIRGPTLAFTAAVAAIAALLCGLIPAVRASSPDLTRLREGGRGSTRRRHWSRDGLVVAQTALALVLLIGSGLLIRSYGALRSVDPGYDTAELFTFQIAPEAESLADGPSYALFHTSFRDRIAALPGVASVGLVENVPLNEGTAQGRFQTEEMSAEGKDGALLHFTFADGNYFPTAGVRVLRGRAFEDSDHVNALGYLLVSRSAAAQLWPGQDPIGKRMRGLAPDSWVTVIGEVEDVMQDSFRETAQPLIYFPLVGPEPASWAISSPAYVVKTARAETIGREIREMVRDVAPGAPMYREYTMARLAADSMVDLSFTMLTLGVVSLLALVLGAVGLYGVLSYIVAERTREIGVRMALGAKAGEVRRMVVAQGGRVVVVGVVLGILVALAATRALGSLLFGVAALDLTTFVATTGAMLGVGLLASYLPARRASSVDPIQSLRGD